MWFNGQICGSASYPDDCYTTVLKCDEIKLCVQGGSMGQFAGQLWC